MCDGPSDGGNTDEMPDAELEKAAQDAREIEAQKAAGRYTGVGVLDEFDRRVQNYGQLPGRRGRSAISGETIGSVLDAPTNSNGFSESSGSSERDGAESSDGSEYTQKLEQQQAASEKEDIKRAKQGRTVISSLLVKRPSLSRVERLGVREKLG
jgi:hypothetical protein